MLFLWWLTLEILSVRGQWHFFSTHEWIFWWKCRSFRYRKCLDLTGTRTHDLRIHGEISSHLSYQGQKFAVPCYWILALEVYFCFNTIDLYNFSDIYIITTQIIITWNIRVIGSRLGQQSDIIIYGIKIVTEITAWSANPLFMRCRKQTYVIAYIVCSLYRSNVYSDIFCSTIVVEWGYGKHFGMGLAVSL